MIYKNVEEAIKLYAEEKRKHEETQKLKGLSSEIVNKFFQNW